MIEGRGALGAARLMVIIRRELRFEGRFRKDLPLQFPNNGPFPRCPAEELSAGGAAGGADAAADAGGVCRAGAFSGGGEIAAADAGSGSAHERDLLWAA